MAQLLLTLQHLDFESSGFHGSRFGLTTRSLLVRDRKYGSCILVKIANKSNYLFMLNMVYLLTKECSVN